MEKTKKSRFFTARNIKITVIALIAATVIGLLPASLRSEAGMPTTPELFDMHGADFTENTYIAQKLQEIFELLPYSDYPYFTTYGNKTCGNSSCTACNGKNVSKNHPMLKDVGVIDTYDSWSCFAFARYAFQYIYGVQVSGLSYWGNNDANGTIKRVGRIVGAGNNITDTDRSKIVGEFDIYTKDSLIALLKSATPGDILQARGKTYGNHTMLFLSADDEGIYVIQNNMYKNKLDKDGNYYGNNRVMISYMRYDSLMTTWNSIFTVYRALEDTYKYTWSLGNDACEVHTFTDEDGDYCSVCGFRFARPVVTSSAGVYTVSSGTKSHKNPYESSVILKTVESPVTVIASATNSIGETWHKLSDGSFIKADNAKAIENSSNLLISMTAYPIGVKQLYKSFELRGRIATVKGTLTTVSGYLISSNGTIADSATTTQTSVSLDVWTSDINKGLKFGELAIGSYTYLVVAEDSLRGTSMFKSEFKVDINPESVEKGEQAAPTPPEVENITAKSVILVDDLSAIFEYRYYDPSENKYSSWQTSNLFSNLEPNKRYFFYRRYAETETAYVSSQSQSLVVTTEKDKVAAEPPQLENRTDTSVTLVAKKDHEYSMDGKTWQTDIRFFGLSPATEYMFFQRDADVKISSEPLIVKTDKSKPKAPGAPTVVGVTDTEITVLALDGYDYAIVKKGGSVNKWIPKSELENATFKNLSPAVEYAIYCRLSETETSYASAASTRTLQKTDKSTPTLIPASPAILTKNSHSVTFKYQQGYEYSIDGEVYTTNTKFDNLKAGLTYEFVCRLAETATSYASSPSDPVIIEIIPDKITSDNYNVREDVKAILGIEKGTTAEGFLVMTHQMKYASVYRSGKRLDTDDILQSGDLVRIYDLGKPVAEYSIVVMGDIVSDGTVNLQDLIELREYIKNEVTYSSSMTKNEKVAFFSADVNSDGKINVIDYAILRNLIP